MLFYRFFISLLLVSLVPVAANIYQLWVSQDTIKTSVDQSLINSADLVVSQVDNWVEMNLRSSHLIAETKDIQSMDPILQKPLLVATDQTFEWTYLVFTTDVNGDNITRSDDKDLKFYGDREYVRAIVERNNLIGQQVIISRTNNKPALCLSTPITRETILVGTLVQCSSLTAISEAVASTKIGRTGVARLADLTHRLIAHGDKNELTEELRSLESDPVAQLGEVSAPAIITLNGEKVVAYTVRTRLGWYLSVIQDYDDAYGPLIESKRNAVIMAVLLILAVIAMAYLLGNNVSKPIRELAHVAATFSKGRFEQNIPGEHRKDEIGDLARSINRLGHGIRVILRRYTLAKK